MDRIKKDVPDFVRGVYVLYNSQDGDKIMNVVYIGMARGENSGVKGRLVKHAKSKAKLGQWTHFSVFEVWDNITKSQVEELEGLFRHVYARDENANALNKQKRSRLIASIRRKPDKWLHTTYPDGSRPPRTIPKGSRTKSGRTRRVIRQRPHVTEVP